MTLNRLHLLVCCVALSLNQPMIVVAEQKFNSADWQRQISGQQKAISSQKEAFKSYAAQTNAGFANYVTETWRAFTLYQGKKPPLRNKPKKQPVAKGSAPQAKPPQYRKKTIPQAPVVTKNGLVVKFFGAPIILYGVKKPNPTNIAVNKEAIAKYWQHKYAHEDSLYASLEGYKKSMRLDDWSYYQLVITTASALYPNNNKLQTLATWKWLNKGGFDARVAIMNANLASKKFVLLLPFSQNIYDLSYLRIGKRKYYMLTQEKARSVSTYKQSLHGSRELSRFAPSQIVWPKNKQMIIKRPLKFTHLGKTHHIRLTYDERDFRLAGTYPQFAFPFYFKKSLPNSLAQSLRTGLAPLLQNKNKREKAAILLAFVQNSFGYKTDKEQFGKENYLLPIETIAYTYADCEDRSILYAWLVKRMVGARYIALLYPNHLSVAIQLPGSGAGIKYNGANYLLADPTYLGSDVGTPANSSNKPTIAYSSA